jgi:hypothetical protein
MFKGKIKLSLCLTNSTLHHEDVWGSGCIDHIFFTLALVGGERSASRPCCFTPQGKSSQYPLDRRLGGPKPVWPIWRSENSLPYQDSNYNHSVFPARSQWLYRLRYCGSYQQVQSLQMKSEQQNNVYRAWNIQQVLVRTIQTNACWMAGTVFDRSLCHSKKQQHPLILQNVKMYPKKNITKLMTFKTMKVLHTYIFMKILTFNPITDY